MRNGLNPKEKKAVLRLKELLLEYFPGQVLKIQVFGSKARGEADKFSDIDVFVLIRKGDWRFRDEVRAVSFQVFQETGIDISPVVMEEKKFRELANGDSPFIRNVQREGILVG